MVMLWQVKMMMMMMMLLLFMGCSSATSAFFTGASSRGSKLEVQRLLDMNTNAARVYLLWKYVEPKLETPLANITVDSVRADPSLVTNWANSVDWSHMDARIQPYQKLPKNSSFTLICEVGEGTIFGLPTIDSSNNLDDDNDDDNDDDLTDLFDPNVVGVSRYLAYIYMTSRAIVARYAHVCSMWQIENELNEAWLAGALGQRRFQLIDSAWRQWDFLTQLLATLRMAVKDHDATLPVTQNIHTDVAHWVHEALFLPGFYADAVKQWQSMLDYVSLDAYPNMYAASPCGATVIATRIKLARSLTTKPVFIMETSYPIISEHNAEPPAGFNFTVDNQLRCLQSMVAEIRESGAAGLLYFTVATQTGVQAPPGGYNQLDVRAINLIARMYSKHDDVLELLQWFLHGAHMDYLEKRLPAVVNSIAQGFGVLNIDGSPKHSYSKLQQLFAQQR